MLKPYTSNSSLQEKNCTLISSVTYEYSVFDPPLTSLGEQQARSIRENYPFLLNSSAFLVSSPLRRTLQTSLLAFNRNPLPHPEIQENSAKPCDTGRPTSILCKEFPELDFKLVGEGWNSKRDEWAPDESSLANRASRMRKWLKDHDENEIIVVTHGGNSFICCVDAKDFCYTLFRRLRILTTVSVEVILLRIVRRRY